LRLDVPHNSERTIEMLSAKETAIHLENLRQSHEITRQMKQPLIVLHCRPWQVWTATFHNVPGMAKDTKPLPFKNTVPYATVAAYVAKRFPHSDITVRL
jgi:hypothetical protein